MPEVAGHSVWLYDDRVGTLYYHDNYTWFEFDEDYLADADRPVLGLRFEENLRAHMASNLRLPPWFSNLLPEGILREWIAADRGVSSEREMELLAQVGHDLPGAVRVLPDGRHQLSDVAPAQREVVPWDHQLGATTAWRFSLAGVGLKFSMLRTGDRFTCSATGEGGNWIVKLPDTTYPELPLNEYTMMRYAGAVGIEVPDVEMVHRDELEGLPAGVWPAGEEYAYAVRRFDRGVDGELVHIEDFAQVRNFYPIDKYKGNFETLGGLIYRGRDHTALEEFTRRLTLYALIGNGDAHLKNWSLIYRDRKRPTLSPAYDVVSTELYRPGGQPEDLGLKFGGSVQFDAVKPSAFDRLSVKLGEGSPLGTLAADLAKRAVEVWPGFADELSSSPSMRDHLSSSISGRARKMMQDRGLRR